MLLGSSRKRRDARLSTLPHDGGHARSDEEEDILQRINKRVCSHNPTRDPPLTDVEMQGTGQGTTTFRDKSDRSDPYVHTESKKSPFSHT